MNSNCRVFYARLPHPLKGHENVPTGSSGQRNSLEVSTLMGLWIGQGEHELVSRSLEALLMQAIIRAFDQPVGFWRASAR